MWYNGDHFMYYGMELDKARIYLLTEQLLAYQLHCHRNKGKDHNSHTQLYFIKFLKYISKIFIKYCCIRLL